MQLQRLLGRLWAGYDGVGQQLRSLGQQARRSGLVQSIGQEDPEQALFAAVVYGALILLLVCAAARMASFTLRVLARAVQIVFFAAAVVYLIRNWEWIELAVAEMLG